MALSWIDGELPSNTFTRYLISCVQGPLILGVLLGSMLWFWTGRLYTYSVGLLYLELGPQLWYSDALYSSQEPFSLEHCLKTNATLNRNWPYLKLWGERKKTLAFGSETPYILTNEDNSIRFPKTMQMLLLDTGSICNYFYQFPLF